MRRFTQIFTAFAVLATSSVALVPAPAEAQSYRDGRDFRGDRRDFRGDRRDFREQRRFVERFCARNPGARDCREFRRDSRRWDDRRYGRWYRDNYRDRNRGDAAAAAIFGFAAGAAAGAIAGGNSGGSSSAQRCAARYRTYDARTNTYIANSRGERRVCQL